MDERTTLGQPSSVLGYESLRVGDVLRDRFELKRLLGEGGMSRVFLAHDRLRGEPHDGQSMVAIKLLKSDIARHPEAFAILQSEARRVQSLAHPNIAPIFDLDRDKNVPYLVMEYLRGTELDAYLRDHPGGVSLRSAAPIIAGMAAGLSYAHARGIVHLDFKPSNVFVLTSGEIKIFDFGISQRLEADFNPTLGAVTPRYASPEAQSGFAPDVRDDVFSFAVTVYELLSGIHPFGGSVDAAHPLSAARLEQLSRSQWRALKAGLALNREARASSVDEVAAPFVRAKPPWRDRATSWIDGVSTIIRKLRPRSTTLSVPGDEAEEGTWVADQPISMPADDCLMYLDYATALFGVIDHPKTTPPLTIAINGGFGIGKSSVALLTQYLLTHKLEDDGEKPHVTAWLHVGRYRGAPGLRAAFLRDLVRDLYYSQKLWFRLCNYLPRHFLLRGEVRRRRVLSVVLLLAVGLAAYSITEGRGLGKLGGIVDYPSAVGILSSSLLGVGLWLSSMLGPLKSIVDYIDPANDGASATQHAEARRQIEKMIDKVTGSRRRFVLFVDDLERSPERTLEVLDILDSLFSTPRCVVVIPTDLNLLGHALERHSNVPDGWRYLEKYVQLQFDMPSVEAQRLLQLLRPDRPAHKLSRNTRLGHQTIAAARERIDQKIRMAGVTGPITNSIPVVSPTRWNRLVDERKQRALTETEVYKSALRLAVSLAGRDVRAAKRISNHIRLYVFVLFKRRLLNSTSALTAEHLGRWVALKELWPEVTTVVNKNPTLLAALVQWSHTSQPPGCLDALKSAVAGTGSTQGTELLDLITHWDSGRVESLRGFLDAAPRLDGVAQDLCYLREAVDDT